MRIGLDLDNTLIDYSALFSRLAGEHPLVPPDVTGKTALRDYLRERHGDEAWQHLQAKAYGPRILEATLFPGVQETLRELRGAGHTLRIISHKSRHTALLGAEGPDLHAWAQSFLDASGLLPLVDEVVFAATREEKCAAIARTDCAVFVDDLPEVFGHPTFPAYCRKILFGDAPAAGCAALRRWAALPSLLVPEISGGEVLHGGRNSRVRRVKNMVIKRYADDGRERCQKEWNALTWLRASGFADVPEPLAADPQQRCAILAFVEGARPPDSAATADTMADFVSRLYALRRKAVFPPAADACFSGKELQEHLERRLERLSRSDAATPLHRQMHAFLAEELEPAMRRASAAFAEHGVSPEDVLPEDLRLPSPSDFGPHNALRRPDGRMVFLDFEYFGLDDPVKLMADCLLHPGMELADRHRETVVRRLLDACRAAGDKGVEKRLHACLPLWRMKWCCILLNEFLPREDARRVLAGAEEDRESRLRAQLDKARAMLRGNKP